MASSTLTSLLQALHIVPSSVTSGGSSGSISGGKSTQMSRGKVFLPQATANGGSLPSGLAEITLEQVAQHDTFNDCWIVIYDRVYDVTDFLLSHPGGDDVIIDHAGRDATLAFHGTGHSRDAIEQMRDYLIGELPPKERIFRRTNGRVLSTGIPE